jgi:hypothetical protein
MHSDNPRHPIHKITCKRWVMCRHTLEAWYFLCEIIAYGNLICRIPRTWGRSFVLKALGTRYFGQHTYVRHGRCYGGDLRRNYMRVARIWCTLLRGSVMDSVGLIRVLGLHCRAWPAYLRKVGVSLKSRNCNMVVAMPVQLLVADDSHWAPDGLVWAPICMYVLWRV